MLKNYQTLAKTLNIWPKCRRNFGNFDRSHCLSDSFGGTAQKSNLNVQCGGWLDLTLTSVTRFGKISLLWQIFSGLWHIFDSLFLIWLDIASHMTSCNQLECFISKVVVSLRLKPLVNVLNGWKKKIILLGMKLSWSDSAPCEKNAGTYDSSKDRVSSIETFDSSIDRF